MIRKLRQHHIALVLVFLISNCSFAQLWKWQKGSNTVNNPAVYGTLGTANSLNTPGARYSSLSWTDASGNLWLFGGQGYNASGTGRLNDLWKYNISTSQWTWVSGSNGLNSSGVYGTMGTAASTNVPGSRMVSATWVDNSGNLWLFGGEGYDSNGSFGMLNDLWKYNVGSNTWTWMSGANVVSQNGTYGTISVSSSSNTPGARRYSSGWKDGSGNFWLFGGYGFPSSGSDGYLSDLWMYNVSTGEWTWESGSSAINQGSNFGTAGTASVSNVAGARYGHMTWKDNSGNFWLFGGYGFDSTAVGYLSDVWKYNPSNGLWTWMHGSKTVNEAFVQGTRGVPSVTNTPGGRHVAASWTDGSGNLYLLGGANGGQCSDMWRFQISTGEWTWIRGGNGAGVYGTQGTASVTNDPGAGYVRTSWRDNSGNFWLFGGIGSDVNGNNSHLNELWETTLATAAPTASFVFNQTSQVCVGTRIQISDVSTNQPVAWTYSLDGVSWSGSQNPFLQNLPTITLSAGLHTVSLLSANSAGYSTPYTQTINVLSNSVPVLTTTPSGSVNVYIGTGQTIQSDWSPWVFTFNDPLPPGASITRVVMTYDGVDQGFGGTGVGATMYLADQYIGGPALLHSIQSLTIDYNGAIPNYINGGINTFKMYFWGYPGWQAHIYNANLQIYYQTTTVTVCAGNTVTLTAIGADSYTWTNGASNGVSHTPSVTAIYTVNASSLNGCVTSATMAVVVNTLPVISLNSGAVCSGQSFTILPAGASTYTFLTAGPVVTPVATSVYSVTGTSLKGCVSASPGISTVTVLPLPVITAAGGQVCLGGTFTINPTGASTYTYSSGSAMVSPTVTSGYTVSGTSSSGCTAASPALLTVTVNPLPVISVAGNSMCAGQSLAQSASGAASYTWNTGATTSILSVSPPVTTSYTVTGADLNGCVNSAVNTVTVLTLPTLTVNSGSICAGGSFTILPAGAITYTYSGGSAVVSPSATSNYSVTGADSFGCVSLPSASTVTVNPLPVLSISGASQVCEGSVITQTASGAASYSWSSGANTASTALSPTVSTTYTVTGTDALGCSNTKTSAITVNPRPIIGVNSGSICSGKSFTIIPSGAATYTYSSGTNIVSPVATTGYSITGTSALGCISAVAAVSAVTVEISPTLSVNSGTTCSGSSFTIVPAGAATYTYSGGSSVVNPATSTSYSITGTSVAGCAATNTAVCTLTVFALPVLSVTGPNNVCTGASVTETVTGASTYTWSTGTVSNVVTLTPTVATAYSVTGRDALGCLATAIKTVNLLPRPVITVNSGTICSGNIFTLNPSGAVTYSYSSGSNVVSPTVTSVYSVTGSNSNGCASASAGTATVLVYVSPTVAVNSGTTCAGGSFTVVPSGADYYSISGNAFVVNPGITTSYSVTGTSTMGCVSVNTAVGTVTVSPLPVLSISGPNAVCNGSSITETVTGASSYSWSTGATTSTLLINVTSATNYIVTGTNSATGCVGTTSKFITVGNLPVISVNSGNVCAGTSFTMIPGGANTYTITNGTVTVSPVVSPTATTSYYVTGTSSLGCVSSGPAISNVIVSPLPVITANSGAICTGGTFIITPGGANTYTISGGTGTVSPASTTSYSVTGTTMFGCVSASPGVATVTVNSIPVISAVSGSVCSGNIFTITPSGAASYTFSSGSSTVTPAVNSTYSVTGTSSAGCVASNTAVVNVSVSPVPTISVANATVCSGTVYTFNPTGALTYSYSAGSQTVQANASGSYSITGTNGFGCVSPFPAIASLTVLTTPTISVNSGNICAGSAFTVSPAGAATYSISGGSFIVSPASGTSYSVTGTGSNGCPSGNTAISTVTVNAMPVLSISGPSAVCLGSPASYSVTGAASYLWSTSSTASVITVSPFSTTTYSVKGSVAAGCTGTAAVNVGILPLPTISVNSGASCPGMPFVISPTGAVTYTISGGSATVSPQVTTSYPVMGTGANGCVSAFPAISTVSVVNTASILVTGPSAVCSGDSAVLQANGTGTIHWSTGSGGNVVTVTPSVSSAYTVTNMDGACVDTAIVFLTVNPLPVISASASPSLVCQGESALLSSSGANTYVWNMGGNSSSVTVNPLSTAIYTVTGKDVNGCANSATVSLTVNSCVGLESHAAPFAIKLYPNPNTGEFVIESPSPGRALVFNALGETVLEIQLDGGVNKADLGNLSKGMYWVHIVLPGDVQTVRVVRQ